MARAGDEFEGRMQGVSGPAPGGDLVDRIVRSPEHQRGHAHGAQLGETKALDAVLQHRAERVERPTYLERRSHWSRKRRVKAGWFGYAPARPRRKIQSEPVPIR